MLLNNGIFKLKVKLSIKVLSELGGSNQTTIWCACIL